MLVHTHLKVVESRGKQKWYMFSPPTRLIFGGEVIKVLPVVVGSVVVGGAVVVGSVVVGGAVVVGEEVGVVGSSSLGGPVCTCVHTQTCMSVCVYYHNINRLSKPLQLLSPFN